MRPTVLYVEDEADDVFFMDVAFKRLGGFCEVKSVEDGAKAIAYLAGKAPFQDRSTHPVPAVIVLDLNLPVQSGFEVLEWLRSQTDFQSTAVLVFSSSGRPEDRERAQALGATDYMLKPTSGTQFMEVARRLKDSWLSAGAA